MSFRSVQVVTLAIAMSAATGAIHAATVGTQGEYFQGEYMRHTQVGSWGSVTLGNHMESGDTLSDLVGQGGNAITVNMSDELAATAEMFSITAVGCSGAGTQWLLLNATTEAQVCAQIDAAINQGCRMRADGAMDIVAPFLCTVSEWRFTTGVVPPRASWVDMTLVTDADAASVDHFYMKHGSTVITGSAADFSAVSNVAQLASALSGLSNLIDVTYSGTTLRFRSAVTGPYNLTDKSLAYTTPATTTYQLIESLDDATAAKVNKFVLVRNSNTADTSAANFSNANNLSQLATELSRVPAITASVAGAGTLKIAASTTGYVNFNTVTLNVRPVLNGSGGSVEFTENGSALVDGGISASYAVPGTINAASVQLSTFTNGEDFLNFTPMGGVIGSYSSGTLSLSGIAPVATYQAVLRSVSYGNSSHDPSTSSTTATFKIHDGADISDPAARGVNVNEVNDKPTVSMTSSALDYMENDDLVVDGALTLADFDHDTLQSAVVTIGNGFAAAEDELVFSNGWGISGAFAGGVLSLTGPASLDDFRSALRTVRYRNSSENPDETTRTISITVHDGVDASNAASRQATVASVNDRPVVTLSDGDTRYLPTQAIPVDPELELDDVDHVLIDSARVTIDSGFIPDYDFLDFVNQNGIAGFYDQLSGELVLIGSADVEHYFSALRSITFRNTQSDPGRQTRTIKFEVDDGVDWSDPVSKAVLMPIFADGFEDGGFGGWTNQVGAGQGSFLPGTLIIGGGAEATGRASRD